MKQTIQSTKWFIPFVMLIFCLFHYSIQAMATETATEVPRVVFENTENTSPDLFVTKEAESADDRYTIPEDAVFTFVLKLNGELADTVTYRVYNGSGQEVFQYADGQSTEDKANKIPFKTDRSGTFTLKAGQTAMFEYVGTGTSYEVTEIPADGFEQTVPAGGVPSVGTVPPEGAGSYFLNTYYPESESELTKLEIRKQVVFPAGYDLPETPDFIFTLKIKNKVHGNENYSIVDITTGSVVGSGTTDAQGQFTLKGGQTAIFEDIPAGVDYEVTEAETEGWRVVGEAIKEGATQAPITMVNYTNVNASFVVTKKINDNSKPEVDFTFLLTDENRSAVTGAKYYLYSLNGTRLNDIIYETDAKGQFVLQPGQAAVFFGIEAGTKYNVSESAHQDFVQQLPTSVDGYTGKEVKDAVEILPFVNKQYEEGKVLSVTKKVENTTTDAAPADAQFTFRLLKKEGETYVPVADAIYSILVGSSQSTYKTTADGTFTLKANQTARFETLKANVEYKVEEINLGTLYQVDESSKEGLLEKSLYFTFINSYGPKKVDLHLTKEGENGTLLAGAKFVLYKDKQLTEKFSETEYVSDTSGNLVINDLEKGIYYLVETEAPAGYNLLKNPIKIEILISGNQMGLKVNDKDYTMAADGDPIYFVSNLEGNDEAHLTVYNTTGFQIPIAGGIGTIIFIVIAVGGIIVISMIYLNKSKQNKKAELLKNILKM